MKFSVLTPCNMHDIRWLSNLGRSLYNQTDQDFEWIVVCHDSTQIPSKILQEARVVSDSSELLGSTLQRCIKCARGHYVIYVAADDYLMPTTFHRLDNVIKKSYSKGYDLNPYPTYEPMESFVQASRLSKNSLFDLPDYGGPQRDRVKAALRKHTLTLSQLLFIVHGRSGNEGFKNVLTLCGKVIPRQIALKESRWLNDDNPLYPQIDYTLHLLQDIGQYQTLDNFYYIKVHHNDPINDPSLSQRPYSNRWDLWMSASMKALHDLNPDSRIRKSFERYILTYITHNYFSDPVERTNFMSIHNISSTPTLKNMADLLSMLQHSTFRSVSFPNRLLFKLIRIRHYHLALYSITLARNCQAIRQIIINRGRGITKWMYFKRYLKHSVNPKVILFGSFLGRSYSDNPKYIYKYIQKHYTGQYQCVWIADQHHFTQIKQDLKNQPNTTVVSRFGFRYMFYLATAKYFVFNMRQPKWFVKRPGMRFIETWHGTPLKHLVFDIDNITSASLNYKAIFYHQSRQWDYLVTDNPFSYRIFKHAFMYPQKKMLKSGYPRNDVLVPPYREQVTKMVKKRLGIPLNKKVILYAPTWRDNEFVDHGCYNFDLKLNLSLLRRYLSNDYVLLIRTHYFITNRLNTTKFSGFVYDVSNYDDISQLYLISDVLITDYSSVFFDYANLKRPILFFVYDYDSYAEVLRGFYLNMKKDLPGPLIKTNRGILHAIKHLDQIKKQYRKRYQRFNQRFNVWDDGRSASRVAKTLLKK